MLATSSLLPITFLPKFRTDSRVILKATSKNVIPAKAGIQNPLTSLASRLRGSDKLIIIRGFLNRFSLFSFNIPKEARVYFHPRYSDKSRNAFQLTFFQIRVVFRARLGVSTSFQAIRFLWLIAQKSHLKIGCFVWMCCTARDRPSRSRAWTNSPADPRIHG